MLSAKLKGQKEKIPSQLERGAAAAAAAEKKYLLSRDPSHEDSQFRFKVCKPDL